MLEAVVNRLAMVGITHQGVPSALFERIAVRRQTRPDLLAALRAVGCSEAVLLSTGSRVEIYLGDTSPWPPALLKRVFDVLAYHSGATPDELAAVFEVRTGQAAVEHLFLVTAGLQSRVLGEAEILAQTQLAFCEAAAAGMASPVLGGLFSAAVRSGRRVRAETFLGEHARSCAHQAVNAGLATVGGKLNPAVLVVGSGHLASAAVDQVAGLGIRPAIAAEDVDHAARLTGTGSVWSLAALTQGIADADLLVCTTSAAHHVVTASHVSGAMSGRTRPLTIVDLSVPRNVDAAVAQVPGVRLIDIEEMADAGIADPELAEALATAVAMADLAAQEFFDGLAGEAGPIIAALRRRFEQVCQEELAQTAGWGALETDALACAAHAIAGKLLHRPIAAAREAADAGDVDRLGHLCDLFGIPRADVGLGRAWSVGAPDRRVAVV